MLRTSWVHSYWYLRALYSSSYRWLQVFYYFYSCLFCYGFPELILEVDSLEAFKVFKAKVELQQGKKDQRDLFWQRWWVLWRNMMRRGTTLDLLHGTYRSVALMSNIQCLVCLSKMELQKEEIVHFLTWCDVGWWTLSLAEFLLGKALRTAANILNQVPSKSILKTPLWLQRKPILHHFHVWDCKAEDRPYNP